MTKSLSRLDKRATILALIFALAFSLMLCVGCSVDKWGGLELTAKLPLSVILIMAVLAFVNYFILVKGIVIAKNVFKKQSCKNGFLINWIIIFLCWIPVFLAEYPGFFVYDAYDEYMEVANHTYTTHHPLLHVLLLGGSVSGAEKLFGNANIGIALYIICQMILVSALFAWIVDRFVKSKFGRIASVIWFGAFPTIVMFALCSVKDTLFAAFMVVAVALTFSIIDKKENGLPIRNFVFMGLSLLGMMLMRKNGVYAVVVFAICMSVYTYTTAKTKFVTVAITFLLAFVSYKAIDTSLLYITGATDTENQEILTVPIQQLARTYSVYKDEMSKEDIDTLYEILPETALNHYTPNLSDPVKVDFDNKKYASNPAKYRALWWKLFKEHPVSFLNAWLCTSYGYYYPGTIVNVYEGHVTFNVIYTESSYFGYEVELPGKRVSLIPIIDRIYRWLSLNDDIQRMPVISFLFSMAGMFILLMIAIMIFFYQKDYVAIITFILPVATWLTLLLGPTFLPRYTVFLWFLTPLILSRVFDDTHCE